MRNAGVCHMCVCWGEYMSAKTSEQTNAAPHPSVSCLRGIYTCLCISKQRNRIFTKYLIRALF